MRHPMVNKTIILSFAALLLVPPQAAAAGGGLKELLASASGKVRQAVGGAPLNQLDEADKATLDSIKKTADELNVSSGVKKPDVGGANRPTGNGGDDIKTELFDKDTILQKYGSNMTNLAKLGKFDHIQANPDVIRDMIIRLVNPDTPSITLTAQAGVGKTAAVEAFTKALLGKTEKELSDMFESVFKEYGDEIIKQAKKHDSSPEAIAKLMNPDIDGLVKQFKDYEVIKIDAADFVSGTHYRGTEGEKISKMIQAASERKVILFVDEIHQLPQSVIDAMKSGLTTGNLRIIGATTTREFAESLGKDAAIVRRMPPYEIPVPKYEEALKIVKAVMPKYTRDYLVRIQDGAAEAAVEFSKKFIPSLQWPNSALEALKMAMASKSLVTATGEVAFQNLRKEFALNQTKLLRLQKEFARSGGTALKEEIDVLKAMVDEQLPVLLKKQSLFEAQMPISNLIKEGEQKIVKATADIKAAKAQKEELIATGDDLTINLNSIKESGDIGKDQKAMIQQIEEQLQNLRNVELGLDNTIAAAKKEINISEIEVQRLIAQRTKDFPEAAEYSMVTAKDIIEALLVKAGKDLDLIGREMKDEIADITHRLTTKAKLSPQAVQSVVDEQIKSMMGIKANLSAPNIYLAAGSGAGIERFATELSKGLWGKNKRAIVVDMKKYGSKPQDVFGVERANFGDMKAGFVADMVNSKMFQTIVFKNIEDIQGAEMMKYFEDIITKGKIEVQFGNETRLVDFGQTNIVIATKALEDTSSDAFVDIAQKSGTEQTMAAIRAIEESLKDSFNGQDLVDILRQSVSSTIPVAGLKSDDALEIIQGSLKSLSDSFLSNQSVRYSFDSSVYDQLYKLADQFKANAKDLQIQDITNMINSSDFLAALARQRYEQGIVAGDKVLVKFVDGQWVVTKLK